MGGECGRCSAASPRRAPVPAPHTRAVTGPHLTLPPAPTQALPTGDSALTQGPRPGDTTTRRDGEVTAEQLSPASVSQLRNSETPSGDSLENGGTGAGRARVGQGVRHRPHEHGGGLLTGPASLRPRGLAAEPTLQTTVAEGDPPRVCDWGGSWSRHFCRPNVWAPERPPDRPLRGHTCLCVRVTPHRPPRGASQTNTGRGAGPRHARGVRGCSPRSPAQP